MTTSISATEIWGSPHETVVDVRGLTQYRVTITKGEAHIIAPGVDVEVELDEEVHPTDDAEACAVMLVAQLEGGVFF